MGLRDPSPFAEVTGGDLLELSPEELVSDFGVSRFQVCPYLASAHCFFCKQRQAGKQPCAHGALRSQAKKVAMVQRAHALFNTMTASPGRAEVTVAELRVRTAFLHGERMPCAAVACRLACNSFMICCQSDHQNASRLMPALGVVPCEGML